MLSTSTTKRGPNAKPFKRIQCNATMLPSQNIFVEAFRTGNATTVGENFDRLLGLFCTILASADGDDKTIADGVRKVATMTDFPEGSDASSILSAMRAELASNPREPNKKPKTPRQSAKKKHELALVEV